MGIKTKCQIEKKNQFLLLLKKTWKKLI